MTGGFMDPKQREALRKRILELGYPAYVELVKQLLERLGYDKLSQKWE